MPAIRHLSRSLIILPLLLLCNISQASVVLSGTRIIFPASEKEVTLQVTNPGDLPALIQAWLDKGDSTASLQNVSVPFVMTPSIFRMEPKKGQTLRILYSGEPLPADRESLFWLNVLDVPPKAQEDTGADASSLQFAFRTRIKLMYRPKGLPGTALDAPAQLQWSLQTQADGTQALQARNDTPYVVNLGGIALDSGGQDHNAGAGYVLPGQAADFPLPDSSGLRSGTVKFTSINDWGGSQSHEAPLAP